MNNLDYLQSVRKQFKYYKHLGDRTFDQIPDEGFSFKPDPESNNIAIIVRHMWGNMLSRWTDFLTSDGEKEWRRRDEEFDDHAVTRDEVLRQWNEGWTCLFAALDALREEDFEKTVYIRNQGHSVIEAINRQLAHYPYHVGQIVFIGKMLTRDNWQSLSIPKNKSGDYNAEKFSQPKHKAHFTDEFLKTTQTDPAQ